MAPFVAVPNVAEYNFNMLWRGQKVQNRISIRRTLGWTAGDLLLQAQSLETWWTDNYADKVSSQLTLNNIAWRDLTTQNGLADKYDAGNAPGDIVAESVSNNDSINLVFGTGFAGRAFHGSNRPAGIVQTDLVGGVITGVYATNWVNAYNTLRTTYVIAGNTWVVASRKVIPPATGGFSTAITTVTIPTLFVASQKSRIQGRGQ